MTTPYSDSVCFLHNDNPTIYCLSGVSFLTGESVSFSGPPILFSWLQFRAGVLLVHERVRQTGVSFNVFRFSFAVTKMVLVC